MTHIPIAPHTDDAPAVVRDIQHYMRPGLLQLTALPAPADDAGMCVGALGGLPGVDAA